MLPAGGDDRTMTTPGPAATGSLEAGSDSLLGARERLRRGRVLVVGVGGLGAPAAWQLAAAGVGTLGLIDFDAVDISNLPRQLLYRSSDIGRPKVLVAAERLARFSGVSLQPFTQRLSPANATEIISQFDFVIDGTDRVAAKYLLNDAAVLSGVPFSHAGIVGFQGQTMTVVPRQSACFRCLFPSPPPEGEIPTCQEAGVIGPLAGTIGLVQALEALKYVLGAGRLLTDRLLIYDAAGAGWRSVRFSANQNCPLCGDRPTIHQVESVEPAGEVCR